MAKVTNNGRTVATKGTDHIAAAIAPDVCYVQKKKKDFPNWVASTQLKKGQTTTVFIDKHPIWTSIGELGPLSEPAHEGRQGGVVSKTYRFEAMAVSYSSDLFKQGNPVVRTEDLTSQNHENTVGRVVEGMDLKQLQAELEEMVKSGKTPSWGKDVVIRKRGDQYIVLDRKNQVFYMTGNTLKIEGNPTFVRQTREALYTLADTRSGRQLFDDLIDSKMRVRIVPTTAQNGFAIPNSFANAQMPGQGTRTTIQWNPSFMGDPGTNSNPTLILGHELVHAHHNALGINAGGPWDTYPPQGGSSARGEERMTVGTSQTSIVDPAGNTVPVPDYSTRVPSENSFRQDLGIPPRPTYYPPNFPGGPPW